LNTAIPSETVTKFYYNFGAGVEFAAGPKISLFAQARYVSIATEGQSTQYIPISFGIKLF